MKKINEKGLVKQAVELNNKIKKDTVVLEPRTLDSAIVRVVDCKDGGCRLCYDYEKLISAFMRDNDWDYETAVEWVDFNTVRAIPYMGGPNHMAPLIWSAESKTYL